MHLWNMYVISDDEILSDIFLDRQDKHMFREQISHISSQS